MTSYNHKLNFFLIRTTIALLVLLSVFCQAGFAANDNPEADRLIQSYVNAVQSNDPELIKSAWNDLNDDQDAVVYMRQEMPQLHYLFQVRGLYFQMQAIQEQRPEFFNDKQGVSATVEDAAETLKKDLSAEAVEVANFSVSGPDPRRSRTNGDIAAAAQGITKIDNRQIALGNPNQNRIDNKDLIQDRAQAYFDQKFQEPAAELVPRGNVSVKTPISDVHVQGLFVDVTFKKASRENQYINVYLNDRLIVRDLMISQALEFLRIYLEPGTNVFKISTSDLDASKKLKDPSVIVNFKKTLQGEQKFSLKLLKESAQTLRIEASP